MAGKRKNERPRCHGCGLHTELCLCEGQPCADLATKVVVVQNNHERNKPTNTARLLQQLLVDSQMLYYAVRDQVFDASPLLETDTDYFLLFPGPDAQVLTPELVALYTQPKRKLVVLDGTWAQCSRMSHRVPGLENMVRVMLPEGGPSDWGVRIASHEERLCTFEATTRALAVFEGADALAPLTEHFREISRRMLYMKGKLAPPCKRGSDEPSHDEPASST